MVGAVLLRVLGQLKSAVKLAYTIESLYPADWLSTGSVISSSLMVSFVRFETRAFPYRGAVLKKYDSGQELVPLAGGQLETLITLVAVEVVAGDEMPPETQVPLHGQPPVGSLRYAFIFMQGDTNVVPTSCPAVMNEVWLGLALVIVAMKVLGVYIIFCHPLPRTKLSPIEV